MEVWVEVDSLSDTSEKLEEIAMVRVRWCLLIGLLIISVSVFLGLLVAYCLNPSPSEAVWHTPLTASFWAMMLCLYLLRHFGSD